MIVLMGRRSCGGVLIDRHVAGADQRHVEGAGDGSC